MASYRLPFDFNEVMWKHSGPAAWCFVSLPLPLADEIRSHFKSNEQGWGRLPVTAIIGQSTWETAIWFDTKRKTYLLPIKSLIRTKENLQCGVPVDVKIII